MNQTNWETRKKQNNFIFDDNIEGYDYMLAIGTCVMIRGSNCESG